jgi:hypothetical protein
MIVMTPTEAAWVAGIVEGEGTISITSQGTPFIKVSMTDEDVVRRLRDWTGVGRFATTHPPAWQEKGYKRQYIWQVAKAADVLLVAEAIGPFLLGRRAARLAEIVPVAQAVVQRMQDRHQFCPHGHDKTVLGYTKADKRGKRQCAECNRIKGRRQHALRTANKANAAG